MNIFKSTALQFKHCVAYLKVVPSIIPTFKKKRKKITSVVKNIEFFKNGGAITSRIKFLDS
jgi:hypothetical protein